MRAKATLEVFTELDVQTNENEDSLAAAKKEIQALMKKLMKVAVKVRCTSLVLQAAEDDLNDLSEEQA
jgi:hypothetical protein